MTKLRDPLMPSFAWTDLPLPQHIICGPYSDMAEWLLTVVPPCPARSLALRHLLDSRDVAVQARQFKEGDA